MSTLCRSKSLQLVKHGEMRCINSFISVHTTHRSYPYGKIRVLSENTCLYGCCVRTQQKSTRYPKRILHVSWLWMVLRNIECIKVMKGIVYLWAILRSQIPIAVQYSHTFFTFVRGDDFHVVKTNRPKIYLAILTAIWLQSLLFRYLYSVI